MNFGPPRAQLCVDNSVLESVQVLTINSQIKVTTLTHLDDLKINDDCECQEVIPPPRKFRPMHITFLIDGSDGYNEKTRNKIGYTEANAFDLTMKWVYWFINSSNFSAHRGQKVFISVIQFAGCSQDIANYKPGQNPGIARPAQDDFPTTYHWIEVDTTVKPSQEYFNVNKKVDQLDGNGCLYLALQDVSLKNGDYLRAMDNKIAQKCDISQGIDRNLIICTDEEWDIKNLISAETGMQAEPMDIISMANETYDRIYAIIATDFKNNLNSDLIQELRKSTAKKTRPNLYNITNKDNSFELRLMRIADQIQIDLDLSP